MKDVPESWEYKFINFFCLNQPSEKLDCFKSEIGGKPDKLRNGNFKIRYLFILNFKMRARKVRLLIQVNLQTHVNECWLCKWENRYQSSEKKISY